MDYEYEHERYMELITSDDWARKLMPNPFNGEKSLALKIIKMNEGENHEHRKIK